MKLLLDSHVFLWLSARPELLSPKVQTLCADTANKLLFSSASLWELEQKYQLGKLPIIWSFRELFEKGADALGIEVLPILDRHVWSLGMLPLHHRDPFDRMLAAQSVSERLPLVTRDAVFSSYPIEVIW